MRKARAGFWVCCGVLAMVVAGCTSHPAGERAERAAASDAGRAFAEPAPPLPENPTVDDLVRRALLANADLERAYWEWRSAIEQIPQDGTQPTNLVLFAGVPITRGSTSFDRTTVTLANDPMADILWPSKPATAARRALEMARAAGLRFQKTRLELRGNVLGAYDDYALTAELIRLEEENAQLLRTTATTAEARNRAGAGQQDLLKARNELDLSLNDLAKLRSQLPAQRAALNALLDRPAAAPLAVPATLPTTRPIETSDERLLARAAARNPELAALARDVAGKQEGLQLARLHYLPDFSLSASSDLAGVSQSLMGMVTVPLLRHEAIDAAVRQAEATLRAADAMRRQAGNDLAAVVVADLATIRDADRQLALYERTVLPRARQMVTLSRSAYEAGQASLLDLLDSQRSLISIRRLVANVRVTREKRLADLEARGVEATIP
jgi:outer membrane protein TolC